MKFVVKSKVFLLLVTLAVVSACSSVDCPLNNKVCATYAFKNSDGSAYTLTDTLTVNAKTQRGDTTLFNRGVDIKSFSAEMSYAQPEDELRLQFVNAAGTIIRDTIWIQKENHPHLESVDCAPRYFHTITGVKFSQHLIDNIAINDKEVNYDISDENFHIYLRTGR